MIKPNPRRTFIVRNIGMHYLLPLAVLVSQAPCCFHLGQLCSMGGDCWEWEMMQIECNQYVTWHDKSPDLIIRDIPSQMDLKQYGDIGWT